MEKIILDEGYQFGLGAFETIAVYDGVPVLLDEHMERLAGALEFMGIDRRVSAGEVKKQAETLPKGACALKVMVSEKNLLFTCRENPYEKAGRRCGFRVLYSPVFRNETSPLVGYKTFNYGDCILEKRRSTSGGADELLFANSRGEICEGTSTNIFFERDGKLYTPAVQCGLLPGVMRRWVLEHFEVAERVIRKGEEVRFEGCFLTNSLMGVMPVIQLEEKRFPISLMTEKVRTAYDLYLRENG